MKILILGGDGFCGWPTALHLSNAGHDITIVDNLSRRKIDLELNTFSLTPIRPIEERLQIWKKLTNNDIAFHKFDVAKNYSRLKSLLYKWRPDAIVHFAEQRAAPYSMKSAKHKRYTVFNNLNATNNLLAALVETGLNAHVIHLGTMGVYGYSTPNIKIPEGYLHVNMQTNDGNSITQEILYPANPGSIYHMTKAQDQLLFAYYNKNDGIRVTDLHQGIVWGTQTNETRMHNALINRFDYDGDYGTVLNRFLMQATINYHLTVHGSGNQTRAFINIQDTVRCIELAILNPPTMGSRVQIMNQATETHRIIHLAKLVSELTGAPIQHVVNPRNEADSNELEVENSKLLLLGLKPITLKKNLLIEIIENVQKYLDNVDLSKIPCVSMWRQPSLINS